MQLLLPVPRHEEGLVVSHPSYTNRYLLRLPSKVEVYAPGSSTPTSRVDYHYDDYGSSHANLTSRSGIVMHDAAFDPFGGSYDAGTDYRGNVTSVTTYTDAGTESGS